jgi:exodeoxyribonuclease VII large subunit
VAIIRGGGGDVGLSCYNDYNLAKAIALFPIPVITGIGHATNETVTEMISFANAITPTKLAEFLLQKFHNYSVPVQDAERKIMDKSKRLISEEKTKFQSEIKLFRSVTENIVMTNHNEIRSMLESLRQQSQFVLKNEKEYLLSFGRDIRKGAGALFNLMHQAIRQFRITIGKDVSAQVNQFKLVLRSRTDKLLWQCSIQFKSTRMEVNNIEKNIINMSPEMVLRRGYSITLLNGKVVKEIDQVTTGGTFKTTVFEGNIVSSVMSTSKTRER